MAIRLAAQSGEGRAGVGEGVDANSEPGHAVAAQDADHAEAQDDGKGNHAVSHRHQPAVVGRDNDRDENPEQCDELALGHQIGLAGLVDQLGDVAHRLMNRHILQLPIDHQAEEQAAGAEEQSDHQQGMTVNAEKAHARQIRQRQAGFAAGGFLRAGECGQQQAHSKKNRKGSVGTIQEGLCAFLDGAGVLARKEKGHSERKRADGLQEIQRILCSHNSSMRKI